MKSWRTSTIGVIGALIILLMQGQAVIDSDPLTNLDLDAVIAALAVLGIGAAARDNGVTSESAGAV